MWIGTADSWLRPCPSMAIVASEGINKQREDWDLSAAQSFKFAPKCLQQPVCSKTESTRQELHLDLPSMWQQFKHLSHDLVPSQSCRKLDQNLRRIQPLALQYKCRHLKQWVDALSLSTYTTHNDLMGISILDQMPATRWKYLIVNTEDR